MVELADLNSVITAEHAGASDLRQVTVRQGVVGSTIIAGDGKLSSGRGCYQTFYGIGRQIDLVNVRVLDANGQGTVSSVIKGIGYTSSDIPALVEGTLPQHRVTKLSPRPAGPEELARLFEDSLTVW